MSTWLVTGASRGIGLEFVRQIAAAGDAVFATARSPASSPELQQLAASSPPGRVHIVQLDVDDAESIRAAGLTVQDELQGRGLDYLVNNAARGGNGDLASTIDPQVLLDTMRSNVVGPALVYQTFLPALERSKRPEGPVVVNITTGLASIGRDLGPADASYSISKHALNMLTYKQSKEKSDIIFLLIHPGRVKTRMGGVGGGEADLEIPFSVSHQHKMITAATLKDSGTYRRYNGEAIPW